MPLATLVTPPQHLVALVKSPGICYDTHMRIKLFLILSAFFSTSAFATAQLAEVKGSDLLASAATVTVSADSKKALVVVFLSAKCPCSNSHLQELKALKKDYPEFSFVAIHSNVDEGSDLSVPYFKKAELPFPILQDLNSELADRYQAAKTPHAFVIRPSGEVAYQGGVSSSKHFDEADRKYLREALEDIQNGRAVKTQKGRALGCVISRGEKNVW